MGDDLVGTDGDDVIYGGLSGDKADGGRGNDLVYGGDQFDDLKGGAGSDTLYGGDGRDYVDGGGGGDDLVFGDAGDDQITVWSGQMDVDHHETLDGGSGRDSITLSLIPNLDGHGLIIGGTGDDTVEGYSVDHLTVYGGDGDDSLTAWQCASGTLDGGDGDDRIVLEAVNGRSSSFLVTLGSGADTLVLQQDDANTALGFASVVVTDLQAGPAGDRIVFSDGFLAGLLNWRGEDLFQAGYLNAVQVGADVAIRLDVDGSGSNSVARDFLILKEVRLGALSAFNLGGFAPGRY